MLKDIRNIIKEESTESLKLSVNHREKFEARLNQMNKPKRNYYYFLKIAATLILLVSLGYFFLPSSSTEEITPEAKVVDIGNVSPEMKQIENYYLTAINYEMSNIEPSPENKAVLDTYLKKIAELTDAYKQLSIDLTEKDINEQTVNALITNLQMRLQLLLDLKDTLNEIKKLKIFDDENTTV